MDTIDTKCEAPCNSAEHRARRFRAFTPLSVQCICSSARPSYTKISTMFAGVNREPWTEDQTVGFSFLLFTMTVFGEMP
jgi:hypothetical protein